MTCSFEERLAAQRKEREMATAELGFKKQLSREERLEKKKQRLAAIGKACSCHLDSMELIPEHLNVKFKCNIEHLYAFWLITYF